MAKSFTTEDLKVTILTRSGWKTNQYNEIFKDLQVEINPTLRVLNSLWFGRVSLLVCWQTIKEINTNKYSKVLFCGFNEYYPKLPLLSIIKPLRADCKVILIDYHSNYLFGWRENLYIKQFVNKIIKTFLLRISLKSKNIVFAHLDDRIKDNNYFPQERLGIRHLFLPDPSPATKPATEIQNVTNNKVKILIVGTQTKRKGFDELVKLLKHSPLVLNGIQFQFVGRLSKDTEKYRSFVQAIKSDTFQWEEGFVTEERMMYNYQNCHYVILPYDKSFNASSGVMAYATSFGKPLISTTHGCIGYRVKKYEMGMSYNYGDISGLIRILRSIMEVDESTYLTMSKNALLFAREHSVDNFKNAISNL
ncbi:glycosyltransferase [Ekhidna sp.]|uniref:glycosyltransferase n=1 Tax=Ekhidna sp. TaxID=2608089 RepID=UPI003BAC80B9